jgi:chromosome partitioning protein
VKQNAAEAEVAWAVRRVVAVANQKGGVGKTTTAVNLAFALAELGHAVLLVDIDPQGNATSGLSGAAQSSEPQQSTLSVYDILIRNVPLVDVARPVRPRLDLAPASQDLVGAGIELATLERRERRLQESLTDWQIKYNIVLIDTPPSLDLLTLNALVAADSVLIPIQCEYYALEGLSSLMATIQRVRTALNPALEVAGIVLTMFDARNRLSHDVAREVRAHFPDRLFSTAIPRNVRLSESPSHGLSIFEYEARSAGAESYRALAAEFAARMDGRDAPAEVETVERAGDGTDDKDRPPP